MLCIDDLSELPLAYAPAEYLVREAAQDWERDGAHALRRAVFCLEQGLAIDGRIGDDRDAIDEHAQLLVAMSCLGGQPDQVVGTVRIHRDEVSPRTWWGSRLAVHAAFRHQGQLGATLIRLAVGRARAQGCERFLAHVQAQNEAMFQKLHWRTLAQIVTLHGRPHVRMQAELVAYPPCDDPLSGYVTRGRALRTPG